MARSERIDVMHKTLTITILSALMAGPAAAQGEQEKLRAKAKKKLAKPFVTFAPWVLDYDAARARAKKENKLILAYFTRSYAP